jgi:hypothetical protein
MSGMFNFNKNLFFSIDLSILACYEAACTCMNMKKIMIAMLLTMSVTCKTKLISDILSYILSFVSAVNLFPYHYHYDEYVDSLDSPILLICSTELKGHRSVVASTSIPWTMASDLQSLRTQERPRDTPSPQSQTQNTRERDSESTITSTNTDERP